MRRIAFISAVCLAALTAPQADALSLLSNDENNMEFFDNDANFLAELGADSLASKTVKIAKDDPQRAAKEEAFKKENEENMKSEEFKAEVAAHPKDPKACQAAKEAVAKACEGNDPLTLILTDPKNPILKEVLPPDVVIPIGPLPPTPDPIDDLVTKIAKKICKKGCQDESSSDSSDSDDDDEPTGGNPAPASAASAQVKPATAPAPATPVAAPATKGKGKALKQAGSMLEVAQAAMNENQAKKDADKAKKAATGKAAAQAQANQNQAKKDADMAKKAATAKPAAAKPVAAPKPPVVKGAGKAGTAVKPPAQTKTYAQAVKGGKK